MDAIRQALWEALRPTLGAEQAEVHEEGSDALLVALVLPPGSRTRLSPWIRVRLRPAPLEAMGSADAAGRAAMARAAAATVDWELSARGFEPDAGHEATFEIDLDLEHVGC